MNKGDFRDQLVAEFAKAGGVSSEDVTAADTSELDTIINLGLKGFTRLTYSLYTPSLSFSTTASSTVYSSSGIWWVDNLVLDGLPLRNRDGRPGPENMSWLQERYPAYQTDAFAKPTRWVPGIFAGTGRGIFMYPTPDASYTCYISGYSTHASVTVGSGGDSTSLDIEDYVLHMCARYCALLLARPHMRGEVSFEQLMIEDQALGQDMREYRDRNRARNIGHARRGRGVRKFTV